MIRAVGFLALPLALFLGLGAAPSAQTAPLAVSIDCPGFVPGCDVDFFQTEVGFARFVRDPGGADVAVFITQEGTGGGGRRYDLVFRGRRAFSGRADTLAARTLPGATDDTQRRALLSRLRLGLLGYAARTDLADALTIGYTAPGGADGNAEPERDPWNSWVFRARGNGFFNGQQSYRSSNLFGSFRASRVTDDWKLEVEPNGSYNRDVFETTTDSDADTTIVVDNLNGGVRGRVVRSLGPHWSAAVQANGRRSTFQNYGVRLLAGPAIEYNVFDYAEATRRQLRLAYSLDAEAVSYVDSTLFGQDRALNALQTASVRAEFAQPWGSSDAGVEVSHILNQPDKYRASLSGDLEVRIAQGLNVDIGGRVSFIRDQVNLPASDASSEDVLTQQRELATGYNYFARVGLSYTFGSIYNAVVNERFGG